MSERSHAGVTRDDPMAGLALPDGMDFSVKCAPFAARFILRAPAQVAAFGIEAPGVLRATSDGVRAALWLGPDETLLLASGEDAGAMQATLATSLAGSAHSLVDVSHRQVGLELRGRLATRCLRAGCPLDLRLRAFPAGMATRTIFLKAEIVLWRQAADRFHVEVGRSFAPYLIGHLGEALAGAPKFGEIFDG